MQDPTADLTTDQPGEHAVKHVAGDDHGAIAHVMPARVLLAVFAALMLLTFLTVAATWVDLGAWNLWIAMAIATVKATLVALFFMHLLYDNRFNAVIFLVGLAFVALFVSLTLMDRLEYQPDIERYQEANGSMPMQ